MSEAFEARYSRAKSTLMVVGCVAFVLVGLLLIGFFDIEPSENSRYLERAYPVAGWLSVVTFGFFGIYHAKNVLNPKLAVRLDNAGLLITSLSKQAILWQDLQGIRSDNFFGTEIVVFEVDDVRFAEFDALPRLLMVLNRPLTGYRGWLATNNLNCKHSDVMKAVKAFAPNRLKIASE